MEFKIIISRKEVNKVRMITPRPGHAHKVKTKYFRKIKHRKKSVDNT